MPKIFKLWNNDHIRKYAIWGEYDLRRASQVLVIKNPPANGRDKRDIDSVPGLGRSPGGGHGNPFQHSYLENPMDRGAWWATVHGFGKSRTEAT